LEKIIFITNKVFVDSTKPEGGVSYCTKDFISLLQTKFDVVIFPLTYNRSLLYRIKAKLGIDVFEDYNAADYKDELDQYIISNGIKKVFINLSSTSAVAKVIKEKFGDSVKTILCSHGIEAGDFLHHTVRFKHLLSKLHILTSSYRLGKILKSELALRLDCFDLILTVSEIEVAIEKWLGAKKVFFVPRILLPDFIEWKPIPGRLGFVGDVSHFPNYYGLLKLCEAISVGQMNEKTVIRVVGKPCRNLELITAKFSFVQPIGYLDNDKLIQEAGTWMYYLNLVFYYSKGVSTKLAKGMNWGLPVISTEEGNRGYSFVKGSINTVDNVEGILQLINSRINDNKLLEKDKENVELAVRSSESYNDLMNQLFPIITSL
jgi:hypothetical protein